MVEHRWQLGEANPSWLRAERLDTGLTLADVAEYVGIDKSHLSLIERGQRMPSVEVLERIADALGYEIGLERI